MYFFILNASCITNLNNSKNEYKKACMYTFLNYIKCDYAKINNIKCISSSILVKLQFFEFFFVIEKSVLFNNLEN